MRALPLVMMLLVSVVLAAPEPVLHESFDDGKIDGPVGKAGSSRFSIDSRGIVDLDRGTMAFFYQSLKEPQEAEWGGFGGIRAPRDSGYWSMGPSWQTRKQEFLFNFYDVGFYAPKLQYESVFGRWQAGQWHHLAVVWDRYEGITIYEDGERKDSTWGELRWNWNVTPETLNLSGPLDEVYVFNDCLTDAQIKQLSEGKPISGDAIPMTPYDDATRRAVELARMGWDAPNLPAIPTVAAGDGVTFTFAHIRHAIDAKRPVTYPYEGLLSTTWPSHKYGASARGQRLDMTLAENSVFDHVRLFVHRPFEGRLVQEVGTDRQELLTIDAPEQAFWHRKLSKPVVADALVLEREYGQMGQIDLYSVTEGTAAAVKTQESKGVFGLGKKLVKTLREGRTYVLAIADDYPDTDQGQVIQGETPRHAQNPLIATEAAPPARTLTTKAFGGFQAICEEPQDAQAYDGVLVELVVEGVTQPTAVRIEVKEPIYHRRVWFSGDVVLQPADGKQTYSVVLQGRPTVNMPPLQKLKYLKDGKFSDELLPVPGVGSAISVLAGEPLTWHLGTGGTKIHFLTTHMETAIPVIADEQVEYMREGYAEGMEGHLYSWDRIQVPMTWLAKFSPDRREFKQMWERVDTKKINSPDITVEPIVYTLPENTTGAPEWAFWQKEVMDLHVKHLHWIIDNKQIWTGEFGGLWNDDSTHVENWFGYMLSMDDDKKIHDAMQRYWDGLYNLHLWEGIGKFTQDTCHFSEEGSSNLGMRLLLNYGDPEAYTRAMSAVKHYPKWFKEVEPGDWRHRSIWVGPMGSWEDGAFSIDKKHIGHGSDVVVSMGYLTWYNRHQESGKFLTSHGAGGAFFGPAVDRVTDWDAALKRYAEAAVDTKDRAWPTYQIGAVNELGMTDEIREAQMARCEYKGKPGKIRHYWGAKDTDKHWFCWKVTGDIRWLVGSYQRTAEWFNSHDWLNAEAMPSMDRCPLPRLALIRSRIGATASNRGSSGNMWPNYAISYEKGGNQVASLVTENIPNQFKVRMYPFSEGDLPVQIRTWRCEGTFKVTLDRDTNDDGEPDEAYFEQTMELTRGTPIDLVLPPNVGSILTVKPVKTRTFDFNRADPAISLDTVELVYGDHLVVTVYNLGNTPIENCLVRVTDPHSGRIVVNGEKMTGPLPAVNGFEASFTMVEFKNINAGTRGSIKIELDPEGTINDLNPYNNTVEWRYKSALMKNGGWK